MTTSEIDSLYKIFIQLFQYYSLGGSGLIFFAPIGDGIIKENQFATR